MECTCVRNHPTPLETYWQSVWTIVEWANGRTWLVEQPPLPLFEPPEPDELPIAA